MRLTALVDGPQHVCCRYRLSAFRPWLERAGHSLDLVPLPKSWWRRLLLFRRLRGANVILQRCLLPPWQFHSLRASAARLIFDFDDSVFLRDSYSAKGLHHPGRLRRFARTVSACDAVVAGNSFLAAHALRWSGLDRVCVIPTCVDPQLYPLPERAEAPSPQGLELVWIGSSSTLQGLERVGPLLEKLGEIPGVKLKLVCDRFLTLRRLPIIEVPWSDGVEGSSLASADVGISWVPDDEWSRGKCGLKVLQYMAASLPVVCNPVGVHQEMVRPGETGFLPHSTEDWLEAIARLARDPDLRARMGEMGRRRVEADYSVRAGAVRWLELLQRLGSRSVGQAG